MPFASCDGFPLFYEVAGSGEPLVLLNGVMMTTQSWGLQTRALAERYRCVLHDFRGQLRSPKPPGPLAMEQHVADLAGLLDQLGIESAHLAGTSYGGEVGMMFALAHPERVRRLAVIASVSHVEPALLARMAVWAETARLHPERLYELTAPDNFSERFREANPALVEQGRARLSGYPPEFFPAFAELVDAFTALDLTARLHEIRCPTLVLCGTEDALKPVAYSRTIAEAIPGAELSLVPGAGHAVVIEQPEAVNAHLLRFFD